MEEREGKSTGGFYPAFQLPCYKQSNSHEIIHCFLFIKFDINEKLTLSLANQLVRPVRQEQPF